MDLSKKELSEIYRLMQLTRRFEEKSQELLALGKVQGDFCHTCIGEESITVGACYNLKMDDLIMPSLRGRGAFITKGVPIKILLAWLVGKQIGQNMPKESVHHAGFPEYGILVGTGSIGSDIARATGAALAAKIRESGQIVVDFFGDGASNCGDFHESLNLAAIWKLPIVFICENNQLAMSTPSLYSTAVEDIANRAIAYNIPGITIKNNDVIAVYEAVQNAIKRARDGKGPTLIECKTYRWSVHSGLPSRETRSTEEIERWKRKLGDPIEIFKKQLIEKNILTEQTIKEMEAKIEEEIKEAVELAEKYPFPKPEQALKHVYAQSSCG